MSAIDQIGIEVVVSSDRSKAEVVVPAAYPRQMLSAQICLTHLQGQGVEVNPNVVQAVEALLKQDPGEGKPLRGEVAHATPPRHGKDAWIEWLVDHKEENQDHKVDFYAQSAFTMVKAGEVVGIVHPPTPGEDGRDVLGGATAAREGREIKLTCDESVMKDGKGQLLAQCEGVLVRMKESVSVRQVIEISDYVDFSTGNIKFNGDVIVRKGVRDCFEIDADGNVEVHGLIEAATIKCRGDLVCKGGFAGRELGHAQVKGNLIGRYLDNIEGEVHGNLVLEREAINCQLQVRGDYESPSSTLIGGTCSVTGAINISTIGSGGGVRTELILGAVPWLEPLAAELEHLHEKLEARRTKLHEEQELLLKMSTKNRMTAADKERQTEIMFELMPIEETLRKAESARKALAMRIKQHSKIALSVQRKVHYNTVLIVDQHAYKITDDIKGPLRVFRKDGNVLIQRGEGSTQPLREVADVSLRSVG